MPQEKASKLQIREFTADVRTVRKAAGFLASGLVVADS